LFSSSTEAMTKFSFRHQLKSGTLALCPPCTNRSSGGPSSPSSAVYSSPILLKSQIMHLLSFEQLPKIHSLKGDHSMLNTSLVWPSKVCNLLLVFLRSQRPIVLSLDPVRNKYSLNGLKDIELISSKWAWISLVGVLGFYLASQSRIVRSSPTEPNKLGENLCHATSSTCPLW